jgi:hypothetical protein
MRFSPSYGVRKGFIKDPNWPPAQFPDEGNATDRRFRRIACSFKIRNDDGELISTTGDISEGGARFALKKPLVTDTVEIVGGEKKARAEIIATVSTVHGYVYRTRFLDTLEALRGPRGAGRTPRARSCIRIRRAHASAPACSYRSSASVSKAPASVRPWPRASSVAASSHAPACSTSSGARRASATASIICSTSPPTLPWHRSARLRTVGTSGASGTSAATTAATSTATSRSPSARASRTRPGARQRW